MAQVSEKEILGVLESIIDPDRGKDIVSLGMVSGLQVKDGHVVFAIEVDAERGPALEPLRQAAEEGGPCAARRHLGHRGTDRRAAAGRRRRAPSRPRRGAAPG